jgi:hypothetical protein
MLHDINVERRRVGMCEGEVEADKKKERAQPALDFLQYELAVCIEMKVKVGGPEGECDADVLRTCASAQAFSMVAKAVG